MYTVMPLSVQLRVGKIPWRKDKLPPPVFLDFPGGSDGKEYPPAM